MASTLEEANDYVVLNMEGLETGDESNIIMINPEAIRNRGEQEGGTGSKRSVEEESKSNEPSAAEVDREDARGESSHDVSNGRKGETAQVELAESSPKNAKDSEIVSSDIDGDADHDPEPPGGDGDQPGGDMDQPGGDGDQPGGDGNQPGGDGDQPGGDGDHSGGGTGENSQDSNPPPPEGADDEEHSDDDGVQPLVLGNYDDADSPGEGRNEEEASRPAGDFPILDFSDMDHLDLTGGASSDMNDLSQSFQPQIISIRSGLQVEFGSVSGRDPDDDQEKVAVATDKRQASGRQREDRTSWDSAMVIEDGDESMPAGRDVQSKRNVSSWRNRGSQESRISTTNSDPVIILSDEEEEELREEIRDERKDKDSREDKDSATPPLEHKDSDSTDTAPEFAELQEVIRRSDDLLVRKIAKRENLSIVEAQKLAEEVRKYREDNNIDMHDSPIETDEDNPESNQSLAQEIFRMSPLNIITDVPTIKTAGASISRPRVRPSRFSDRGSPEPVISIPAPPEREPDEITGNELQFYKKLIQNPKPALKSRTIRELLYHKEKGKLPPGNYYTFDDCLIREDEIAIKKEKEEEEAKVLSVTSRMMEIKKEQEPPPKSSGAINVKEILNETSPPAKEPAKVTARKPTVSQTSLSSSHFAQNKPLISLSKTNNQEMPPEGGSTIILPDGTTIKMSPQQAFNITSTINVPGNGQEQEEGECYEITEEDDLWTTHMTCSECGELLPLDEVMTHMVSQHWENNPSCYKCGTCDAWFTNKEDYHTHLSRVVEKSGDFIKMDKLYKCAVCNKYFKDSEFFLKHLHRKHTEVESVGSMKILAEIQERQQVGSVALEQKPPPPKPTPPLRVSSPLIKVKQPTITKTTTISRQPAVAPSKPRQPAVAPSKPPPRSKETSMVRDIGVRLGVKSKFQQLIAAKALEKDLKEGTIITGPTSDSSEEEIPGDEAEVKIEQEEDTQRWAAALSTGPPPKTIAPQLTSSPEPSDASSQTGSQSGSLAGSPHPNATAPVISVINTVTGTRTVTPSASASLRAPLNQVFAPTLTGALNMRPRMQLQGHPIIPASALRPFLNQARPGTNLVMLVPNGLGGMNRIVTTTMGPTGFGGPGGPGGLTLRPGINVFPSTSNVHTVTSTASRGIMNTTASRLEQKIAMRKDGKKYIIEAVKKVPLILQKRNSGRKVNPLLNRSLQPGLVLNRVDSPGFNSLGGAQAGGSQSDTPIVNEEGFDIPQFIEYNKPPTPPRASLTRKRGRKPNPIKERQKKRKRRRGRPRASSGEEEATDSEDEEFDNWLEQVSEKMDKSERGGRRRVSVRTKSRESSSEGEEESDRSQSQESSERNYPIERGKSTKRFNCNLCSKKFLHSNRLLAHMKREHSRELNETIDDAGDVMLKCQICDHCFDTAEQLNFHSLVHMDDDDVTSDVRESVGDFECQYCGEKFEIEDHLNYHVIKHQIAMEEGEEASGGDEEEGSEVDVT